VCPRGFALRYRGEEGDEAEKTRVPVAGRRLATISRKGGGMEHTMVALRVLVCVSFTAPLPK
jgi:hypothetical protein